MERARSAQDRAQRLDDLLRAAGQVFDQTGMDLTLEMVASHAGLTRTTLYGYANSKEALLLLLANVEVAEWFAAVTPKIRRIRTVDGLARVIIAELLARQRVPALLSLCGPVLERNVTQEAAESWKQSLHDLVLATGSVIDESLKAASGSGARFLLHLYASVVGLHSVAQPPPIAAKAIAVRGLDALNIDFGIELRIATLALLHSFFPTTKDNS